MAPPAKRKGTPQRPGRKLLRYDRGLELRFVAGVDEVGRGCLAGPLVAAAVVLDYTSLVGPKAASLAHLNDSKKLSRDMRERLFDVVMECATATSVVVISANTIDRRGLHKSNIAALCTAINRLRAPIDMALVDGFAVPLDCANRRVIKGDSTSAAIAAASIVAKVTRDRMMCRLDETLDGRWAFGEHMGYATPLHHERIHAHGVSDHHRMSFDSQAYRVGVSEGVGEVLDPFDASVVVAIDDVDIEAVLTDAPLVASVGSHPGDGSPA